VQLDIINLILVLVLVIVLVVIITIVFFCRLPRLRKERSPSSGELVEISSQVTNSLVLEEGS
jgi:heme/copper-type cytochrome/quinol oxidase subunit 2